MRPHPPRFALIVRPYNRLAIVLLAVADREVARGSAVVIAREDRELCEPEPSEDDAA